MKSKSVCPTSLRFGVNKELNVKGPTFNYASIAGIASGFRAELALPPTCRTSRRVRLG